MVSSESAKRCSRHSVQVRLGRGTYDLIGMILASSIDHEEV